MRDASSHAGSPCARHEFTGYPCARHPRASSHENRRHPRSSSHENRVSDATGYDCARSDLRQRFFLHRIPFVRDVQAQPRVAIPACVIAFMIRILLADASTSWEHCQHVRSLCPHCCVIGRAKAGSTKKLLRHWLEQKNAPKLAATYENLAVTYKN